MKILKGSTWENLCLRKTFRGGTFSGWKYFQPLKEQECKIEEESKTA